MKKLATLLAGLLLVGAVANAADYAAVTKVNWKNNGGNDPHEIEWQVASGYVAMGENATFIFDIHKSFYELSEDESFNNELGMAYRLPSTEMLGKTFSNEITLKYKIEENEGEIDNKDTTSLVYVTSTDIAGVATSLELIGKLEENVDKYEANVYLGKVFGPFSASVELKNAFDPNESGDAENEFALNTYLNYNYDFGLGFTFNTEFAFKTESEFEATTVYAAPQLKYSYAINEETTFFTGIVYEALKGTSDDLGSDDISKIDGDGKVYLGFSYAK